MPFDAIILAGSSDTPGGSLLKEHTGVNNEALIPIGKKLMVEYVVDALKEVTAIDKIVIVGPVPELESLYADDENIILAEPGGSQISTLLKGLKALEPHPEQRIIIVTSDLPLLTGEAVEDFISQCSSRQGDLFYPIVPKDVSEARYPGIKRTYISLKEGQFTGGNLFLVKAAIIEPCAAKADKLVSLRKSPFSLSRQIGLVFIIKFLSKRLTLRETEMKFSKLLGIEGYSIISHFPEVGIDVDKLSDLEIVERILAV